MQLEVKGAGRREGVTHQAVVSHCCEQLLLVMKPLLEAHCSLDSQLPAVPQQACK